MKNDTLVETIEQAERFLVQAKQLRRLYHDGALHDQDCEHSKVRAGVRRASADLTRLLADLRLGR